MFDAAPMTRPIGPTKERLAHAGKDVEAFSPDENENWRALRMLDSPIEKLRAAGIRNENRGVTGPQYEASKRFYSDWYKAGLAASGVIDPTRDRVDGGSYKSISDVRLAALTSHNRAIKAVGGVHMSILHNVVLMEFSLEGYSQRFREHVRHRDRMVAAITALRLALDALDIHYNGHRENRMRKSHETDYRPAITIADEGQT